ncbi:hypothetical protein SLA_2306 [Streptomyces laurentii]|uniref:HTH cro/C1-type domain-containing protein n=1 Tax=Streptomyces laurentii TaxID=39478 RepID=A0A160NYB0_STRLU|nr:hypothetical protein SLA_2306 [Streptomyces laurentii]
MTQRSEGQTHDQSQGREQSAGVRLARLLRRWWEESGGPSGGTRPTQQALAARLGVDQTTLSRYLNPGHLSTAPLRVVEALHTHLRAPAAEIDEARALCATALRENGRQRTAAADPAPRKDEATPAPAPTPAVTVRSASPWLPPALVGSAVVMAFTAGIVAHAWFSASPRADPAGGAAGAVATRMTGHKWPVLIMREEDQYTRARVLQYLLRSWGYKVRTDGFFREDTRDAVVDFQKKNDLTADGKVGDQTWPELVKEVGPGSGPFEVRALQELLNNVDQGATPVTGTFTTTTGADLGYFQRLHGLPETRRANQETWLALLVRQLPPATAPDYQRSMSPPPVAAR